MNYINYSYILTCLLFFSCSKLEKEPVPKPEKDVEVIKKTVSKIIESKVKHKSALKKDPYKLEKNSKKVEAYCDKMSKRFLHWGWSHSRCDYIKWNHVRNSFWGDPLIWTVFGDEEEALKNNKDVTLVLCGVHGDEITPVKFCFDIIFHLKEKNHDYKNNLVVVAPLVNPDSFFRKRPTRTNGRGVDINRNFPTKDWHKSAIQLWKKRYRSDKRRYPGKRPLSEQETIFQVNLIKRYNPKKIISVHAPLTLIDYDGPAQETGRAKELLIQMSQQASGYTIKNYPFFPGSLGNYAGNERGIPTYTLELPSSDNRKSKQFWKLFKESIDSAIFHDFTEKLSKTD